MCEIRILFHSKGNRWYFCCVFLVFRGSPVFVSLIKHETRCVSFPAGRMAPPTDDLSGKKVKVSVGVARKQSDNEAESIADALSSTSSILASELLEDDKQDSSKSFTPLPK